MSSEDLAGAPLDPAAEAGRTPPTSGADLVRAALERARAYLRQSPLFSHVEVRRGICFMRRIENDAIPGEQHTGPA